MESSLRIAAGGVVTHGNDFVEETLSSTFSGMRLRTNVLLQTTAGNKSNISVPAHGLTLNSTPIYERNRYTRFSQDSPASSSGSRVRRTKDVYTREGSGSNSELLWRQSSSYQGNKTSDTSEFPEPSDLRRHRSDYSSSSRRESFHSANEGKKDPGFRSKEGGKRKLLPVKKVVAGCYGCGAELQTEEEEAPGFVSKDVYELKARHRQLSTLLCGRCRQLAQGAMVAAVGGNGGYGTGTGFITAEELRLQLAELRHQKAVIVKLVDIVDFNGSFLNRVRDLVGSNPIILVITKVDLLPVGTDLAAVADWILESVVKKKINVVSVHLTSAKAPAGIASVSATVLRERQGRDVYVMGAANVGKSAFIAAFLDEMSSRDLFAAAAKKRKPIASAMPGTTLGPIPIRAFDGDAKLYDTAGVHLHHRMPAVVLPVDLPLLAPKRRLRGYVASAPHDDHPECNTWQGNPVGSQEEVEKDESGKNGKNGKRPRGMEGLSLFWGGLVRVDVLKAPASVLFTFYGATDVRIQTVATEKANEFYNAEVGKTLVPPTIAGEESVWEGLPNNRSFTLKAIPGLRPAGDISISGLGWINVSGIARDDPVLQSYDSMFEAQRARHDVVLKVHMPRGVEAYVRDAIPVGKLGAAWYRYAELSEKDESTRPKAFFEA